MSDIDAGATPPPDVDLDRVWIGVAAQVWRRQPGPVERTAARLLRSQGLARALLTTPSLLLPWLIASVAVLAAGVAATRGTGQPLVALLAPAMAATGIAYAYGPGIDPAWELSRSMAVSDRMVLLVRALAVFAVNALLGLAASVASWAAVPARDIAPAVSVAAVTFGWLVPMTAMCAIALAVASLTRSALAGATAGMGCWVITVLSGRVAGGQFSVVITGAALILPYLLVAAAGTAVAVYATRISRGTSR